jgi:hypothetical protein
MELERCTTILQVRVLVRISNKLSLALCLRNKLYRYVIETRVTASILYNDAAC